MVDIDVNSNPDLQRSEQALVLALMEMVCMGSRPAR